MKLLKHLGMSLLLLFLGTSTFLSIIFFLNLKRLIIAYIIFGTAILVITILLIRRMTFKNKRFLIFYGKWGTASIIITSLFLLINSTILVFLGIAAIQLQSPDLKASLQSNISIYSFYNTTKSKKYSDKVFNKEQYNNVNLYYLKDIEHGIPLVKHYLDNIQEDCESILIPVNLRNLNFKLEFNEEEYNSLSTLYKEYKGIYISSKFNNQISMIAVDAYEDILGFNFKSSAFKDTLRHEYTHYYLDMFFKDNNSTLNAIPVWFNEGVAEYISMVSPIFSEGFPKKIIPFNKLYTDEEWSRAIEEGEDIYLQSHFAIFNLSDLKGVDIIKRILKSTLKHGFNEAFKKEVGLTVEEYEEKLRDILKAHKKNENNEILYNKNVDLSIIDRDFFPPERIRGIENYVKEYPEKTKAYMDISLHYERERQYDKALAIIEKAAEIDPRNEDIIHRLGLAAFNLKDYKKAEESFRRVTELQPDNIHPYINLAQVLLISQEDKALEILEKAHTLSNNGNINGLDHTYLEKMIAYYKRYIKEYKNGDPLKAAYDMVMSNDNYLARHKVIFIEEALSRYPYSKSKYKAKLLKAKEEIEEGLEDDMRT